MKVDDSNIKEGEKDEGQTDEIAKKTTEEIKEEDDEEEKKKLSQTQ